jgi:glycosyltransferase involved in cell wall biosynthesis
MLFTAHGLHLRKYDFLKGVKNKIKRWLRFNLERYLFKSVNQLICVSKEDMNFIEQHYQVKNVNFITNGLDFYKLEETPFPTKAELRKNLELPQKATLFLTIARFDFAKGYDILLQTILLLKEYLQQRKVYFLFIGDGPEREKIQQIVSSNNMTEYIKFLGEVYPTEKLLISCDAFILPSRWEGLPISLLEAGHFKIPIIASDTFGIREIIENNISGLLFRNESAENLAKLIQKFLQNEYDLERMTQKLYLKVHQNFDLHANMNQLKSLYHRMMTIQ